MIGTKQRQVKQIAKTSLKPKKYSQLLHRMVQHYQPKTVLEIGTSLGITTCYLAKVKTDASVITMEGSKEIAGIAKQNFRKLRITNVQQVLGNFDETLPSTLANLDTVDLAFMDIHLGDGKSLDIFEETTVSCPVIFITACEVYVTPYLNEAQITSGTLSYAVGSGAAVVSTPYWHAQELLSHERGRLFDFKNHEALSDIVNELMDDDQLLNQLKQNAYQYGLHLRYPVIGSEFIKVAQEACIEHDFSEKILKNSIVDPEILPKFSLTHVLRLTDDTGIVQHAKYGIPNLKEGYCLDDNARALIMALMAHQRSKSNEAFELLPVYLSYIHYMQTDDGNFRNFLSFDRRYLDDVGSEDSFGRTIWALGHLIDCAASNSYREFALEIFRKSFPHFESLTHLRGMANTIIGISLYLNALPTDEGMQQVLIKLTKPLIDAFNNTASDDWLWFEE
ncbi:MAG: hypothetical protein EOO88_46995, partial [Pedobacter sp.]